MKNVYLALLLLISVEVLAIDSEKFGEFRIDYTTFPSTSLNPEIAKIYGIKRSKHHTLINVFVSKEGKTGGVEVELTGNAKNLMAQQQSLSFMEIKEDDTVYYIAPIRVSGKEEILHIYLRCIIEGAPEEMEIKFSKTFYRDL